MMKMLGARRAFSLDRTFIRKDGYTVSNVESINVAYNVRILGIDGVEDDGLHASAIA